MDKAAVPQFIGAEGLTSEAEDSMGAFESFGETVDIFKISFHNLYPKLLQF